jgi:hypothetical protein
MSTDSQGVPVVAVAGAVFSRIVDIPQLQPVVPALQLIWQALEVQAPNFGKPPSWLVISQHGAQMHDLCTM